MNNNVYSMGFNDGYNKAKQELLSSLQEKIEKEIDIWFEELNNVVCPALKINSICSTKLKYKVSEIFQEMGQ